MVDETTVETGAAVLEPVIAETAATYAVPATKAKATKTKKARKPRERRRRGTILELAHRPGSLWGRYTDPVSKTRKQVRLTTREEGTDAAAWDLAEERLTILMREARLRDPESEERGTLTLSGFLAEFMAQPSVPRPTRAPDADKEAASEWKAYREARKIANEEAALSLQLGALHVEGLRERLDRAARYFGATALAEIGKADAKKYVATLARDDGRARLVTIGKDKDGNEITERRTPKMSAATRNRHLAALSKCWDAAIEGKVASMNPWKLPRAERPKGQKFAPRFLTGDEVARILSHLPEIYRPMFEFLAESGLRLGEAQRLAWQRVARDFASVTVEESKSGEPRVVDCSARAREILKSLHRSALAHGADLVFLARERTYLWAVWNRACLAAGVGRGVRVHDLRHYCGSSLAQAGVPLSTVQKILGHKSARMTEIYASHVPTSATAAAFAALDAARAAAAKAQRRGRKARSA